MITLNHGDHIYLEGWTGIYDRSFATVGTVRGYAIERGDDPEDSIERAWKNGHEMAWAWTSGNCIYGDRAYAEMMAKTEIKLRAAATMLSPGQKVKIEGVVYTVWVPKGNERGPRNCDPIHFVKK